MYGGRQLVTIIPGDGIGRELCNSVRTVFSALNVPVDFEQVDLTGMVASTESSQLPAALDSLKRNKVGLKGILYTGPHAESPRSLNVALRQKLDLFASLVHCRNFLGQNSRYPQIDVAIVRENLEGEYAGLEHSAIPGVIESLKICTRHNTERTVKFAFDWAVSNGRKKVTCIHKANIMKLSDGLFLKVFREIAHQYRLSHNIIVDDMIVDNAAMQIVSNPAQFDLIVTSNLYGNIMANIVAGLIGSPGLVPGYNIGHEVAVFEPGARHVAKDIEGLNAANPVSMLLSSAYMLQHLGLHGHSSIIRESVNRVIETGNVRSRGRDSYQLIPFIFILILILIFILIFIFIFFSLKLRIWVVEQVQPSLQMQSWNRLPF